MGVNKMKKWEKFTEKELESLVANARSYRDLASQCGYAADSGTASESVREMVVKYNFNTEHFTGQGWRKNNFDYSRFQKGVAIKISAALLALTALRGHKCEVCNNSQWNNQPIALEIHHIDGDSLNNTLDNLQLNCPNCHAQTDNYRGKNISQKTSVSDEDFVVALRKYPNVRQALLALGLSAKGGNYSRAYALANQYQIIHIIS